MKTRNFIISLILALIGGFILRTFTESKCPEILNTDTIYVHSVIRDTIFQDKPVPYKVVEYKDKLVPTTVYKLTQVPVDTAMILAEFGISRAYADTLVDNSDVYIHLSEVVRLNRLYDRQLIYEIRKEDKIITNTISPDGFYFVGGAGYGRGVMISGEVLYLRNNRFKGIEVGYLESPFVQLKYGFRF